MVGSFAEFQSAFTSVYKSDPDRLLELEMEYCYEFEFKPMMEEKHMEWILDKPLVVQGTLFSVINYCPYPEAIGYASWQSVASASKSDEQNIVDICNAAAAIPSTAGSLAARFADKQPKCGKAILNGDLKDVEGWVRTGQPAEYDL